MADEAAAAAAPATAAPARRGCRRSTWLAVAGVCAALAVVVAVFASRRRVAGGFDAERAVLFARLAGAAYCSPEALANWSCGENCVPDLSGPVMVCAGDTTQAYIGKHRGEGLVAFQGTKSVTSMVQDLRFFRNVTPWAPCAGCNVHMGFLSEWLSLRPCVERSLRKIARGPIRVTGHSLGGAVGTLAMVSLASSGWRVKEAYTFGSPRVGDANFSLVFSSLMSGNAAFRVTHHQDPVPHLPPEDFGFMHVAPEVFIDGNSGNSPAVVCAGAEDVRCAGQYNDIPADIFHLGDHLDYMGVRTCSAGCSPARGRRHEEGAATVVV